MEREVIVTTREVSAKLVPAGTELLIPSNTFVTVTQALGGTYTVAVNGNLARINGEDADALGKEPWQTSYETPQDGSVSEDQVWEALKQCYDPEIPVNIVDLGLIYDCKVRDANQVHINMTLTAPGCGMGPVIVDDVKEKVSSVPNVTSVEVDLVFDPPWSNDMLTDEAKLELGLF